MRKTKRKIRLRGIFALLAMAASMIALIVILAGGTRSDAINSEDPTAAVAENSPEVLTPLSAIAESTPEPTPVIEYESLGEFTLTAYCPCVKCCGEWSAEHPSRIGTDYIQKTASGTIPTAGRTIGVDTSVIPFGTIVVINEHEYVAEDRGGAINGNKVDIYFESHEEALEFGRQMAEIFIKTIKED